MVLNIAASAGTVPRAHTVGSPLGNRDPPPEGHRTPTLKALAPRLRERALAVVVHDSSS